MKLPQEVQKLQQADIKRVHRERLEMYQRYPDELAEEIGRVVRLLPADEDRIIHNSALGRFLSLFHGDEEIRRLWRHMAQAVLDVANTDREEKE